MTPLIDYIHTTDYTPCYGSYSMAICCWLVAICDVDVSCHVVGVYVYIYIYISGMFVGKRSVDGS